MGTKLVGKLSQECPKWRLLALTSCLTFQMFSSPIHLEESRADYYILAATDSIEIRQLIAANVFSISPSASTRILVQYLLGASAGEDLKCSSLSHQSGPMVVSAT